MKKIVLILLTCLLTWLFLTTGALGAAGGNLSLAGNTDNLKQGGTLSLSVKLDRNPGVKSLSCTVSFDANVLTYVSAEDGALLPEFSCESAEGRLRLSWSCETDRTETGTLAKLLFQIREDAIYGDSTVSLSLSEASYDAQNSRGESVAFDTAGIRFALICPHENPQTTVEKEATLEEEGILKQVCPACGNTSVQPILPTVKSCDGQISAAIAAGEFANTDRVEVFAEDLYGTEEGKSARELLGKDLYYAFRIRFTKNGEAYVPLRDITVTLTSRFPLPQGTVLYALMDAGTAQPRFEQGKNTLEFAYDDVIFALVHREKTEEPTVPESDAQPQTNTTTVKTSTAGVLEEEQRRDQLLIVAGAAVLVLCGAGIILMLAKRKRF